MVIHKGMWRTRPFTVQHVVAYRQRLGSKVGTNLAGLSDSSTLFAPLVVSDLLEVKTALAEPLRFIWHG